MTFERPLCPRGALFRRLQPRSSQYRILSMAHTFQGGCTSSSFDPHMYLIRNHATAVTTRLQARYLSAPFTTAASSNSLWYILPFTNKVRYFLSNMVRSIFTWNSGLAALILLCSLFFTQPFCKASGSKCFTRDGNPNSDLPCYPTESESFCCGSGWACLPNRICAQTERSAGELVVFARGSCTDQLWLSTSQCPDFCLASS